MGMTRARARGREKGNIKRDYRKPIKIINLNNESAQ